MTTSTLPTVRWPEDASLARAAASPFATEPLVPGERRELAPGVAVTPWPVTGLLVLRGARERVAAATVAALGVEAPGPLASVAFAGSGRDAAGAAPGEGERLRWTAPDEWLLSCPIARAARTERALREAGVAAVTEVSCAQLGFDLDGERVEALLARSTSCDVHPSVFPPGKVVGTVFAKTTVTLGRLGPTRFELIARRSFADYLARWLRRVGEDLDVAGAARAQDVG